MKKWKDVTIGLRFIARWFAYVCLKLCKGAIMLKR